MHILKQLAGAGLLSERLYQMPEDAEGDHTTVDQAKIDPNLDQNLDGDANPQEADIKDDDAPKEDEPKDDEKEEDEEDPKPASNTVQIDASRSLAALHAALHSTQVLADLVYGAKDELVAKLGDEAAPALHEVLFKVKTAHETLAKLMDAVSAEPAKDDDAAEEPAADDTADPEAAPDQDSPVDDAQPEV